MSEFVGTVNSFWTVPQHTFANRVLWKPLRVDRFCHDKFSGVEGCHYYYDDILGCAATRAESLRSFAATLTIMFLSGLHENM